MRFRFTSCAGGILLGLVLFAPAAHAGLVGSAVDRVGSAVAPVVDPSSPSTPPAIPRAPEPPPPAPKSPAPRTPAAPTPVAETVQAVADTATGTVRAVTGGSAPDSGSGGQRSAVAAGDSPATGSPAGGGSSGRSGSGAESPARSASGSSGSAVGASAPSTDRRFRTESGAGSIFDARPAPDPRYSAYVWPAIALGRTAGVLAAAMGVPVAAAAMPLAAELPRILAEVVAATTGGVVERAGPAPGPPPMPARPPLPYVPEHLPDSGDLSFILLLLACLAPLTLFGYTIVRELRAMPRWPIN